MTSSTKLNIRLVFWIIFCVLSVGCATVNAPWDTTDQILLGTTYTTMAIDTMQTVEIVTNSAFIELNPIIGALASISVALVPVYFIACGVAIYFIADNLEPDYRKGFLSVTSIVSSGAVVNNLSIGVKPF